MGKVEIFRSVRFIKLGSSAFISRLFRKPDSYEEKYIVTFNKSVQLHIANVLLYFEPKLRLQEVASPSINFHLSSLSFSSMYLHDQTKYYKYENL